MLIRIYFLIILSTGFCSFTFSQKHAYEIDQRELNKFAEIAKDSPRLQFIILKDSQKIMGTKVKWNPNKDVYKMDKKKYDGKEVLAYQDKWGYMEKIYTRIYNGKLDLYYFSDDYEKHTFFKPSKGFYDAYINSPYSRKDGMSMTLFAVKMDTMMVVITYNYLKELFKSCPIALNEIDVEFNKTMPKKYPDEENRDYRALMRLFKLYDTCN